MPVIAMPNGDRVSFPDDMPRETIRDLIARKFPQDTAAYNQSRIDTAHETAKGTGVVSGGLLPFSRINGGPAFFDANAGLIGSALRALKLPGDAMAGRVPLQDASGHMSPEAIARATEFAAFSPAGVAARMGGLAAGAAPNAARIAANRNIDEAARFGIDLSKGQASRNIRQQAFEEDALTGGRGVLAQSALSGQRQKQAEQVRAAVETLQDRMNPAAQGADGLILAPQDRIYTAARNVGDEIAGQAEARKAAAKAAYARADAAGGELAPESVSTLNASLRSVLDEAGAMEGTAIGADLPNVRRIMANVEALSAMRNAPAGKVVGVGWQNFERIRRQINAVTGSNANEARVLGKMKAGLDTWLEKTVDDGLASGSPEFLDSLKQARSAWAQYQQVRNNPVAIIRKMADRSADSVEIANWIYGANKVGGRAQSAGVVREIAKLIGSESAAFKDLRRNVLTRLFDDVRRGDVKTYGRLAGDIQDFTGGRGRELASALFDADTIRDLNRFSGVLRTLTPDAAATNPSRSGQTVMRRFAETMRYALPALGMAVGDFTGLVAGLGLTAAVSGRAALKARGSVRAPRALPPRNIARLPSNVVARSLFAGAPAASGDSNTRR